MNERRYREAEQRLWQSMGVTPTEHRLALKTSGVSVRVLELGAGPALLFVHGGNASGSSWAALAARLSDFRCILLDRPGCGLSERLPVALTAETFPAFAETLVGDVLDALGLESAYVAGTSLGGHIALRSAARDPGRINRLVLYGWPFGETPGLPAFMRMTTVPGIGRLVSALPANERAVRMIFKGLGHGPSLKAGRITADDIAWFSALLRETDTVRNELAPGRELISPLRGVNSRIVLTDSLLAQVRTPTLCLWGENDPFGGPGAPRRFVQRLPNAELRVLPGAGHAPWLDALDLSVQTTTEFLRPGAATG